tara:strand:- start:1115 stop:1597 length:483 start_codon:yes stop_codon:yes gene_type:complete
MSIESILRDRKIPNDICYEIIQYAKPTKLNKSLEEELTSEAIYRLFSRRYNDYIDDINEYDNDPNGSEHIEQEIPPYLPFMFECEIDSMPHDEFSYYIDCLKKYKRNKDGANYFINSIKEVIGWEMNNRFYDDSEDEYYYEDESYLFPITGTYYTDACDI